MGGKTYCNFYSESYQRYVESVSLSKEPSSHKFNKGKLRSKPELSLPYTYVLYNFIPQNYNKEHFNMHIHSLMIQASTLKMLRIY